MAACWRSRSWIGSATDPCTSRIPDRPACCTLCNCHGDADGMPSRFRHRLRTLFGVEAVETWFGGVGYVPSAEEGYPQHEYSSFWHMVCRWRPPEAYEQVSTKSQWKTYVDISHRSCQRINECRRSRSGRPMSLSATFRVN